MRLAIATLMLGAAALQGCTYDEGYGLDGYGYRSDDYRYGDYHYDGRDFGYGRYRGAPAYFRGAGARLLDPWLANTEEGREIVATGFSAARDGRIGEETAHRANIWFRRYADTDGDLRLTDEEIRVALMQASSGRPWERY